MRFIDSINIIVASGTGGDGCSSFRREKHVPMGGPDGGDGGRGGAVIFEASSSRNTLVDFRFNKTYRGEDGQPGMGRQMSGAAGNELILLVPVGTVISDYDNEDQLADLHEDGMQFKLPGGRGGLGNVHFKSSTNRSPRKSTSGKPGMELRVLLELKLIADVGLLGFPNAGKSTFLAAVSRARPKVADYPFTTLVPQLGVVSVDEGESFVIADIPGLIEGAAQGAGLGHQFLRHIERCSIYLHLISPETEESDPLDRIKKLNAELGAYNPELLERPQVIVLTKTDLLSPQEREQWIARIQELEKRPVYSISSFAQSGLSTLTYDLWRFLQNRAREARERTERSRDP
jgi:GTP-binding protein